MHLRNQLAAIFLPTRRLVAPDQRTVLRGGRLGELQWVVPRADCGYRRIDLSKLPARQRGPAAQIAARRHATGPARFHVAWSGPVAHLWTWPQPADPVAGVIPVDAPWLPESLLRPAPDHDGLRLLAQVRGFEGQFWKNGTLQASQWWPEHPGPEAWNRFVRSCGVAPPSNLVPEAQELRWADSWSDSRRSLSASPAMLERWAWSGVAGAIVLGLGWQLAADMHWRVAGSTLASRMDALRAQAAPLLAARERAELARDQIVAFRQLQDAPSDYDLAASVIAPLPDDARLLGWQREGDKLQVVVRSANTDPRLFVTSYEDDPRLRDVVATPGAEGVTVLAFELAGGDVAQ